MGVPCISCLGNRLISLDELPAGFLFLKSIIVSVAHVIVQPTRDCVRMCHVCALVLFTLFNRFGEVDAFG